MRTPILSVSLIAILAACSGKDDPAPGGVALGEIEPNNTAATATPLPAGGGIAVGSVNPIGDTDYYSLVVPAGVLAGLHAETFDASAAACTGIDTELRLYGQTGTLLASDYDSGIDLCSLIDTQLLPGIYALAVSSAYSYTPFNYVLSAVLTPTAIPVVAESEPNDDGSVAMYTNDFSAANADGPFTSDVVVTGALNPAGDEDVFAVTNPTGVSLLVRFETFEGAIGQCSAIDTYLYLRDAAGMLLASNDDSGLNFCSLLTYTIPAGGTVYAQVTDFSDNNVIAGYLLRIDFP